MKIIGQHLKLILFSVMQRMMKFVRSQRIMNGDINGGLMFGCRKIIQKGQIQILLVQQQLCELFTRFATNKLDYMQLQLQLNKIMIDRKTRKRKTEHIKTQSISETQITLMEFGKPVKLPNIHKKLNRYHNDPTNSRSIEAHHSATNNKSLLANNQEKNSPQEVNLRKLSNNSQLHFLTLKQMQLCSQRSKKFLPKIAGLANCFGPTRENNEYFDRDEFMKRLSRMKSQRKIQHIYNDQLNDYKLDAVIGRGSYSNVKLAYNSKGKKYAVKIYSKKKLNSAERYRNLQRQIQIMKKMNHPNIIQFKQSIETEQSIYLVIQLFDNCSLGDYMKKKVSDHNQSLSIISQEEGEDKKRVDKMTKLKKRKLDQSTARAIFRQTVQAVKYLHQNDIAHRDIKLDNVLLQAKSMKIKMIDFGFSCYDNENSWHEDYCGTPNYISPQILKKQGYRAKPADVWALGVFLFFLVAGYYPFKNPSTFSDFEKIHQKNEMEMSKSLRMLLKDMLQNNPEKRARVEAILESEWMKE